MGNRSIQILINRRGILVFSQLGGVLGRHKWGVGVRVGVTKARGVAGKLPGCKSDFVLPAKENCGDSGNSLETSLNPGGKRCDCSYMADLHLGIPC